jgi:putative oxidoreductase
LQRWAPRYARIAIAAAFLSAVAGRFGLWTGQFSWEAFGRFIARTAELNAWAPRSMIPVLAWSATIAETTLALALLAGVGVRWAAFGSAALLAWFATAMLVYTGLKPPLDYSVYSASACALLLALHEHRRSVTFGGERTSSSTSRPMSSAPSSMRPTAPLRMGGGTTRCSSCSSTPVRACRRSSKMRPCDLQLVRPCQIRLRGKGRKKRLCPLADQRRPRWAWAGPLWRTT